MKAQPDAKELEAKLGYFFINRKLRDNALTHSSFAFELGDHNLSNERLELLGDSVLNFIVTEFIFNKYPDLPEGQLAKLRSALINTEFIAHISETLRATDYLLVGKAAEASHIRKPHSVKADLFEALIGAIYLDGGFEPCRKIILANVEPIIDMAFNNIGIADSKSRLQEYTMKKVKEVPNYAVMEETGPPHNKTFTVTVTVFGDNYTGKGKSKKEAEQRAAKKALDKLLGTNVH